MSGTADAATSKCNESAVFKLPLRMEEQLRASVYKYLVETGEKKAAKALRKAHADEDLDAESPSLQDLFKCDVREASIVLIPDRAHTAASGKKAAAPAAAAQDDEEMPKKDKKKRKKEAEKEAPKEEEPKEVAEEPNASEPAEVSMNGNGSVRKGKKPVERFQRVVASEVEFLDPRLADYSHESKGDDDWGNKANQILSAVRGKDFRHEKTKKKRGTYKGGRITSQVNSIKFDD